MHQVAGGAAAGWPRPNYDGLPVPWMVRWPEKGPLWLEFLPERYSDALRNCLCQVCGFGIDGAEVYVLLDALSSDRRIRYVDSEALLHKACADLTRATCPHWKRLDVEGVLDRLLVRVEFSALVIEGDLDDFEDNVRVRLAEKGVTKAA